MYMQWKTVILCVPQDPNYYCPGDSWVFKFWTFDQQSALALFMYVDDCRTTGFSLEEAWQYAQHVASILKHLGIQDASKNDEGRHKNKGHGPALLFTPVVDV
jgi:hypothetical protein